jgi:hypothetical protein
MKNLFTRSILAAGLGLALTAGTASASILSFTVDETVVDGTAPFGGIFTAHKLNGGYDETLTINPDFSFDTNAVAFFTAYFDAADNPVGTGLNGCSFASQCYTIYALFSASGTVNPGTGVFTGTSGNVSLYVDAARDTTATVNPIGSGAPTVVDVSGDDELVLSSNSLSAGTGGINPGVGGFFDLTFVNIVLTAFGQAYYPDLPVLNLSSIVDGDFDEIPVPVVPDTYNVGGDLSAVFVPEPASMTLFGMTLLGAGLAARRRRSA